MTTLTTLIPAYKADYLSSLFLGLCRQSFQDFRVILSDDSPGGVITEMIRSGKFQALTSRLNLVVVKGPHSASRNHEQLMDLWDGKTPLVHMHNDDDVIYPDFYLRHVQAHATHTCCATVSQRWLSHDDGVPAWSLPLPDFITQSDQHVVQVASEQLFQSTVGRCTNWLGELSNIVMSTDGAAHYPRPPTQDLSYYGLLDIGFILSAGEHLPVTFIREPLSVFRQNAQQTTHNTLTPLDSIGHLAWVAYALLAWRNGRLSAADTLEAIGVATQRTHKLFGHAPFLLPYYEALTMHSQSLDALSEAFCTFWLNLIDSIPEVRAQGH